MEREYTTAYISALTSDIPECALIKIVLVATKEEVGFAVARQHD